LTVYSQSCLNGLVETRAAVSSEQISRLLGSWRRPGVAYTELAAAIRSLVLDGRLPLRVRLPSERELAACLGLSRTTTTAAYDVLREEGFVESRRGSGSRVALPTGGAIDRELGMPFLDHRRASGIDLTIAALPAPGAMLRAVDHAARDLAAHLGGSGYDPQGLPSLRRAIAGSYGTRGVPTTADQIVITSGAQHALALILGLVTAPGDAVVVEVPSYPNAFHALRRAGVTALPAPLRPTGWDVDAIGRSLRESAARLAYLIPDFHNPTGLLMEGDDREAVVRAARRAGAPLVVDETFAQLDLEPWRARPDPVARADRDGVVMSVGSMSKAFWGGLRIGWIRCAAPLARRLARSRAGLDLATPVMEQLVAEHLLSMSDTVLAERRDLLTARRDALVAALRTDLPRWRFAVPRGGLCLWAELDRPDAELLARAAASEGVRIVPGPVFGVDGSLDRFVRLPFTQPPDVLRDAVRRLVRATDRLGSE